MIPVKPTLLRADCTTFVSNAPLFIKRSRRRTNHNSIRWSCTARQKTRDENVGLTGLFRPQVSEILYFSSQDNAKGQGLKKSCAFRVSKDSFMSTFHGCSTDSTVDGSDTTSTIAIAGEEMKILRRSIHADLALLTKRNANDFGELQSIDMSMFGQFSSSTTYSLEHPMDCGSIEVYPVDVVMKLCAFSACFVPFVRFDFDRQQLEPKSFIGLSGCPIIRDDTKQIVGMLIQAAEESYLDVLAKPILQKFLSLSPDDNEPLKLYRLNPPGLAIQPMIHRYTRYNDYLSGIELNLPRVVSDYDRFIQKDDLLYKINGYQLTPHGFIQWGGLHAPLDVAVSLSQQISISVVRDGEILLFEDVEMRSSATKILGNGEPQRFLSAGGVIFSVMSVSLLPVAGADMGNDQFAMDEERVVVVGYDDSAGWTEKSFNGLQRRRVKTVNGYKIEHIGDLAEGDENIVCFDNGFILKLPKGHFL